MHGDESVYQVSSNREEKICPVYTGMNRRATLFAASLTDSPRIHGDTLAALAGNQRILASDKANCQIETLWRTGRFYFCLSFFDQKVLSAKMQTKSYVRHTVLDERRSEFWKVRNDWICSGSGKEASNAGSRERFMKRNTGSFRTHILISKKRRHRMHHSVFAKRQIFSSEEPLRHMKCP